MVKTEPHRVKAERKMCKKAVKKEPSKIKQKTVYRVNKGLQRHTGGSRPDWCYNSYPKAEECAKHRHFCRYGAHNERSEKDACWTQTKHYLVQRLREKWENTQYRYSISELRKEPKVTLRKWYKDNAEPPLKIRY